MNSKYVLLDKIAAALANGEFGEAAQQHKLVVTYNTMLELELFSPDNNSSVKSLGGPVDYIDAYSLASQLKQRSQEVAAEVIKEPPANIFTAEDLAIFRNSDPDGTMGLSDEELKERFKHIPPRVSGSPADLFGAT